MGTSRPHHRNIDRDVVGCRWTDAHSDFVILVNLDNLAAVRISYLDQKLAIMKSSSCIVNPGIDRVFDFILHVSLLASCGMGPCVSAGVFDIFFNHEIVVDAGILRKKDIHCVDRPVVSM